MCIILQIDNTNMELHNPFECSICCNKYSTVNKPICLGCGHIFCSECINDLEQKICPTCRRQIVDEQCKVIYGLIDIPDDIVESTKNRIEESKIKIRKQEQEFERLRKESEELEEKLGQNKKELTRKQLESNRKKKIQNMLEINNLQWLNNEYSRVNINETNIYFPLYNYKI